MVVSAVLSWMFRSRRRRSSRNPISASCSSHGRQGRREGNASRSQCRRRSRSVFDRRCQGPGHRRTQGGEFPTRRGRRRRVRCCSRSTIGRWKPRCIKPRRICRDTAQAANAKVIAQRMDDLVERGVGTREQRDTARTTAAALDAVVGANTRRGGEREGSAPVRHDSRTDFRTNRRADGPRRQPRARQRPDTARRDQPDHALSYVSFGIPETLLPDLRRYMAQRTLHVEATPAERSCATGGRPRSRSSTTPSTRRPARSGSRRRFPMKTDGCGPGSS